VDIKVYDYQGNQRDMAYLRAKYGDFAIQDAAAGDGPVFKIAILREVVNAPASLVVRVSDEDGQPQEGVRVAFYWPDAPEDFDAGPLGGVLPGMRPNRCVTGVTGGSGDTGFGMGHGAYYWPDQGQTGPHAAWIHGATTRSDLILGLGMIAATNHDHFDIEYTRFEEEPDDDDDDDNGDDDNGDDDNGDDTPPCPTDEIEAELAKIEAAVAAIRQLIA
jgi:hypothetical protein